MVSMDDVIPTSTSTLNEGSPPGYDIPRDTINEDVLRDAASARLKPEPLHIQMGYSTPSTSGGRPPSSPTIIVSPPEDDLEAGGVQVFEPNMKDPDHDPSTSGRGSLMFASAVALVVLLTVLLIIILVSVLS